MVSMADSSASSTPSSSLSFNSSLVFHNYPLISALVAFALAQSIKFFTTWYREKRWDPKQLIGSGGMPSSHSATVTSLAIAIGIQDGFNSSLFAASMIFASVVMYDAFGVRLHAGKQAMNKFLDEMAERVPEGTNGQSTQPSKAPEYPKNAPAEGSTLRVENVTVVPDPTKFVAIAVLPAAILVTSTGVSSSEDTGVGCLKGQINKKLEKRVVVVAEGAAREATKEWISLNEFIERKTTLESSTKNKCAGELGVVEKEVTFPAQDQCPSPCVEVRISGAFYLLSSSSRGIPLFLVTFPAQDQCPSSCVEVRISGAFYLLSSSSRGIPLFLVLNQIVFELPAEHPLAETRPLRELLGHTPAQVFAGAILGFITATIAYLIKKAAGLS
ncbi:hypothetical protein M5K25_003913 [Dendrobium thyrsiflorum]|uniref:Acid phosphatase/vanadium-dependent haloperoxidase-related protein n=1 Tax=Dendrobium thyrsiflorum TaxID=117978 RepID=A0ABD0VL66_DENTH